MDESILDMLVVQRLACRPQELDESNELFFLRDDLLPVALGGNKVRIAREFIADMRAQKKDALLMYGDERSNLCRVLALLCSEEGIPCLMLASSSEEGKPSFNELIVRQLGVEIRQVEKDSIAEAVDTAMEDLRRKGFDPYYIYGSRYGTGNEAVAANAYAKVIGKISAWEEREGTEFDLIVVPCGTAATLGGLVAGSIAEGRRRDILGISISSRDEKRARSVLRDTVCAWLEKAGKDVPEDLDGLLQLDTSRKLGGYGVYNERVEQLISWMMEYNSIPLDPVYTGKALLGMLDHLAEHEVRGKRILFVHTGGLPLFFDYLNHRREG